MVIRTEYRGTRYSMGSSDPLPAGFEIRFGGLNFRATGNGYLMRLTNREELRARRQAGSAPVAAARVPMVPTPASTDAAGPSANARELGIQARDRINADFNVDNPDTPPRVSQKLIAAATLLRAMPGPSTPEARNLHREAQVLIEQAAVQ
jgi:hypothetical protein